MICSNCGASLPDGLRFCTSCGAPLEASTPAQPGNAPRQEQSAQAERQQPFAQGQQAQPTGQQFEQQLFAQGQVQAAQGQQQPYAQTPQGQPPYTQPTQQSPYGQAQPGQQPPYAQAQPGQAQPGQQPPYAQPAQGHSPYEVHTTRSGRYGGGPAGAPTNPQASAQGAKKKGGAPIVPIVIAVVAVIVVAIIAFVVMKPGGQPTSSQGSSSPAASAQAGNPSSPDKFYGDWKLAAMEVAGITMAGDIHSVIGIDNAAFAVNPDGTGKVSASGDDAAFTWKQQDADTLALTFDDANGTEAFGGELQLKFDNATSTMSFTMTTDGNTGTMYLSKDGTMEGLRQISMDNAGKVPSEDFLIGNWKLSGMGNNGVSMYGDMDQLSTFMPSTMPSLNVKFKKDGTVSFMGTDATWKINDKGNAVITVGDEKMTVKALGDDIVMNFGQSTKDASDDDVIMMFSKAN